MSHFGSSRCPLLAMTWLVNVIFGSAKDFRQIQLPDGTVACASILDQIPDQITLLNHTEFCNPMVELPESAKCALMCQKDTACLHFNYRINSQSCEMFHRNPAYLVVQDDCIYFGVCDYYIIVLISSFAGAIGKENRRKGVWD